jgi:hypothetical protein
MKYLLNIPNGQIEDQKILKEQLEGFIKKISNFFEQEHIEQVAKETDFVERESKLTGLLFLSLFVFGVSMYGNPTLEQLIGLLNTYVKDISLSRSGLHQRINEKAVAFFEQILHCATNHAIPEWLKIDLSAQFGHIHIWDSTSFQLPSALAEFFPGKGGSASPAGAKIQFAYELNDERWFYEVQAATEADTAIGEQIVARAQPGDLVLQDLGYFNVETFAALYQKGAYYLSRLKRDVNVYLPDTDTEFFGEDLATFLEQYTDGNYCAQDLVSLLHDQSFKTFFEVTVFLRSKHNVFTPARLMVEKLPAQAVAQRLRKLHQKAQSRGKQLSKEAIFLASFNFYVTNAPSDLLPASCCRFLYGIRWQVELVFKSWKSHLHIDKIQVKHRVERVKATILAKLIFITLTARTTIVAMVFLWRISQLEISYFRALRHFQTIAQRWFSFATCSDSCSIFALLQDALAFIQRRSFKIPQHDRLYPLEMLQVFGDLVLTA